MSPGKAPAFQFYPNDFISGTLDLSAEDVGVYMRFLCYQWVKGSLPADTLVLARIAGVTPARMRASWKHISRHFTVAPGGTLTNPRLEVEREKQAEYRRQQSDKGKASAANRKATGRQPEGNRKATAVAFRLQPEGNSSSSSSSSDFSQREKETHTHTDPIQRLVEKHDELHRKYVGVGYIGNPHKDYDAARQLVAAIPNVALQDAILIYGLNDADDFMTQGNRTIGKIASRASAYVHILKEKKLVEV